MSYQQPDEDMYCSWGDHLTDEYIYYYDYPLGICEDCAEAEIEHERRVADEKIHRAT